MFRARAPRPTIAAIALLGALVACAKPGEPSVDHAAADHSAAADEAAIRALDSAWVKAVAAKNAEQATSYYADGGSVLAPGDPMATGKAAIQTAWTGLFALPGFTLTFAPTKIDVSGDRAVEIGDYELTMNDKTGKPGTTKAKYIVVWGRQADGSWKALVDAPTTTQ